MLIASNMFFYAIKIIASWIHPPPLSCLFPTQHHLLCILFPGLLASEELSTGTSPQRLETPSGDILQPPPGQILASGCVWPGSGTSRGLCQPSLLRESLTVGSITAVLRSGSLLCHFCRKWATLDEPLQCSSTLLHPLLLPPKYTFGRSSMISISSNTTGTRPRSREAKEIACKV